MKRGKGRGTGGIPGAYWQGTASASGATDRLPQVRGRALRGVDVDLDPGPELEAGPHRKPRQQVDVPAERLRPAGRRPDPEVELRREAEQLCQCAERGSDHRRPYLAVAVELGRRASRDHPELERRARR